MTLKRMKNGLVYKNKRAAINKALREPCISNAAPVVGVEAAAASTVVVAEAVVVVVVAETVFVAEAVDEADVVVVVVVTSVVVVVSATGMGDGLEGSSAEAQY